MTELSINQALQQGIEAHKAGDLQEADRLYTAILTAQPMHPDANHNMGILAVGVGKVEQALPFFKTALEANAATAQFWLSYIDALIKLDKLADAKAVLNQAKSKGAKGDGFDKLGQRLQEANQEPVEVSQMTAEATPKQQNILDSLKLDQAIKLAKKKAKNGAFDEAKHIYQDILKKFPKNAKASNALKKITKRTITNAFGIQDPPHDHIEFLFNLYRQGKFQQALEQTTELLQRFPSSSVLHNICGLAYAKLGSLEASVEAYTRALVIKPTFCQAYSNLGNTFQKQGELDKAIRAYKKALAINPNYAKAHSNLGNAFQKQGELDKAIRAYRKAIAIKPNYVEAFSNMGMALHKKSKLGSAIVAYNKALAVTPFNPIVYNNKGITLKKQGQLEAAIAAFTKAQAIKPNYAEAVENLLSITVQLLPIVTNYEDDFANKRTQETAELALRPKYQILKLIRAFLEANFNEAFSRNNNYKAFDQKLLDRLKAKDRTFCKAYSLFIGELLADNWEERQISANKVYHLGESHCLSYAHRNITIDGSMFQIVPRLAFGAKAFHFSDVEENSFKAITKAHLEALPLHSKVFISFGEIDCRPNEGFITAARKLSKRHDQLICKTVQQYVQWFLEQTKDRDYQLYFINVPAPVYNDVYEADINSAVARNVLLFNAELKKYSHQDRYNILDVYQFTVGRDGFSNKLFHIDNHHLGAKALLHMEKQLT